MTTDHAAQRAAIAIGGQNLINPHNEYDDSLKDIAAIIAREYSWLIAAAEAAATRLETLGTEHGELAEWIKAELRKVRGETNG